MIWLVNPVMVKTPPVITSADYLDITIDDEQWLDSDETSASTNLQLVHLT